MRRPGFASLILFMSMAGRASAQADGPPTQLDFSRLRLPLGTTVYVTDPQSGVVVSGPLIAVTPTRLQVDGHTFEPTPLLKIEKRGDTVLGGAVAGFLAGGLLGSTVGAEGCLHRSTAYCFLGGGLAYGVVGAFIDWRHKGRTTVFRGAPGAKGRRTTVASLPTPATQSPPALDVAVPGLKVGDTIEVVGTDGATTSGRVTSISASGLRLGTVDFAPVSAVAIDRIGDPIWDGVAMGAAFGGLLGAIARCSARCVGVESAIFAGVAGWIDAHEVRRTRVHGSRTSGRSALRVIPHVGRRRGVRLSVQF